MDTTFADCSFPQEKTSADINAELGLSDYEEDDGLLNVKRSSGLDYQSMAALPRLSFRRIDSNLFLHRTRKTQTIDEISPSQFEAHAGMAARRQPYRHIYTSNGITLHDIAISLAMGQRRTIGGSDDICHVCGDGENLLLCNCCPLAFHAEDVQVAKFSSQQS